MWRDASEIALRERAAELPLFGACSSEEVARFLATTQSVAVSPGELVRLAPQSCLLLVVGQGTVETRAEGAEIDLGRTPVGAIVGLEALFQGRGHPSCRVRAVGELGGLAFPAQVFDDGSFATVATAVERAGLSELSRRLRRLELERLRQARRPSTAAEPSPAPGLWQRLRRGLGMDA